MMNPLNILIRGLSYRACPIVSDALIAFGFSKDDIIITRTNEDGSYTDSIYTAQGTLVNWGEEEDCEDDLGLSKEEVLQLLQDYHDIVKAGLEAKAHG